MVAKRPNRATINDVAQAAGVSISSVSNALNGKTAAMTEETLLRIQAAMQELNYRPSSVARGLATQRTATLGLVLTEIETPLFLQAVTPIEREARQAGYSLLLMNARNAADEREAVKLLQEKQVDGMMIISTSDPRQNDHLHKVQTEGIPVALINRADLSAEFDQVNWDNAAGVAAMMEHFARLGHQRIAILTGPADRRSTQERLQGYRAGLEAAGQTVSDIIGEGIIPATLEIMDNLVIRAVEQSVHAGYPLDAEAVLIIELDGLADGMEEQARRILEICEKNGVVGTRRAKDAAERADLWAGRRGAFGAVARLAPSYLVCDGTVPRTKLPDALSAVKKIGQKYDLSVGNVFHAGDGNLHPLILFDDRKPDDVARVHRAGMEILKACAELGGTISGEHGIGTEKLAGMPLVFQGADLEMMRRVKEAIDPQGVCNPGKLIPRG